ncbi:dTDP-Rha:alpha-D-GlcNAc-pyrophosphate polyprenol%2C alpha-3-L-rhamnosyltransferase [uncultured Clostridium sp.]|uniref:Glycosyltransferase n=1 Tax=Muricoprocola aceti TaxID=2981772 RepID=A0ABT2SPS1_9FIRM|nr:glycosyltransferase [Muricoprocola aceti]MCU6726490.1 glycosyltransferase [Muricoprocola aceti]SCH92263.1 dTDP-Rha:alpha-D-GlcNAc-pyrophosphate polyprenol%2C alpha-3-L-rhamnosyltransferase [uncultured Clostridium sp.]
MDIVLVTYNSEKWINNCLISLDREWNIGEKLNVYIVDNHSSDKTIEKLQDYQPQYFGKYIIKEENSNLGFGKANNVGAALGNDEIICFINIDTEILENTFTELQKEIILSEKNIGAWEMRQLPYEHPKIYNPVTRETSWMSGAAFAVRRTVFEQIKGFDENIFMYAEDVDLSWRIRANGYLIRYCPNVSLYHYSYAKKNEVKPVQYIESIKNNLFLRYRFGTIKQILQGYYEFWKVLFLNRSPFPGAKTKLLKGFLEHWKKVPYFRKTKEKNRTIAQFYGWDYEKTRIGSFYRYTELKDKPLVSVIVRTCGRPSVLRETLLSLRNQVYDNIEIIVVEDGKPTAENMIKTQFGDLNIRYVATEEKKGRSFAGNIGMTLASGKYLNFLDDDDVFYADHVETLVAALEKDGNMAAYSLGFETPIEIKSTDPYEFEIKAYNSRYQQSFDKVKLCHHNYIPIQCIMFSKELFTELGGLDTSLDYLEDWDLWVRYMQKTDFSCIMKTTSEYRVPFNKEFQNNRQEKLDQALEVVRKKHEQYIIKIAVSDLVKYGEDNLWQILKEKFKFNR